MTNFKPFLLLISLLALILASSSFPLRLPGIPEGDDLSYLLQGDEFCRLSVYVKTAFTIPVGGTTSNVSLTVINQIGGTLVNIPNLVDWNLLPLPQPGYVYFQNGQSDLFVGPVDCSPGPFGSIPNCISITITGTGERPSWGCEYIDVYSPSHRLLRQFPVNKWLTPENNSVQIPEVCPI